MTVQCTAPSPALRKMVSWRRHALSTPPFTHPTVRRDDVLEHLRERVPDKLKNVYRHGRHLLMRWVLHVDRVRYGKVSAVSVGRHVVYSPTHDRRTHLLRRTRGRGLQPELLELCVTQCREFDVDVFLDIGANVGEVAVSVADYVRKVVIFEPNPSLVPMLYKTLASVEEAIIVPLAVSDGSRNEVLHIRDEYAGASSLDSAYLSGLRATMWPGIGRTVREVPVFTVSVDDAATLVDIEPGSSLLAKIDVEGYEPEVLAGASATFAASRWWRALVEFNADALEARGIDSLEWWEALRAFQGLILGSRDLATDRLSDLSGSRLPSAMPSHGVDVLIGEGIPGRRLGDPSPVRREGRVPRSGGDPA